MAFLRTMGVLVGTLGFAVIGYAAEVTHAPSSSQPSASYTSANQPKSVVFQQTVKNQVKEPANPINVVAASQDSQTFQERARRGQYSTGETE